MRVIDSPAAGGFENQTTNPLARSFDGADVRLLSRHLELVEWQDYEIPSKKPYPNSYLH